MLEDYMAMKPDLLLPPLNQLAPKLHTFTKTNTQRHNYIFTFI